MIAFILRTILARWQHAPRAQSGQIIYMAAAMMVCVGGGAALAVDVAHNYQQRQAIQNMADNAAQAGAVEAVRLQSNVANTTAGGASSTADNRVLSTMYTVIQAGGGNVRNVAYTDSTQPSTTIYYKTAPANTCSPDASYGSFNSGDVALQAVYTDASNTAIVNPNTDSNGTHYYLVGDPLNHGLLPAGVAGVKVLALGSCIQAYFAPILGHTNFNVGAQARTVALTALNATGQNVAEVFGTATTTDTPQPGTTFTPIPTVTPGGPPTAVPTATAAANPNVPPGSTSTITPAPSDTPTATSTLVPAPTTCGKVIALDTATATNGSVNNGTVITCEMDVNGSGSSNLQVDGSGTGSTITGTLAVEGGVSITGTSGVTINGVIATGTFTVTTNSPYPSVSVNTGTPMPDPYSGLATPTNPGVTYSNAGLGANSGVGVAISPGFDYPATTFGPNSITCFKPGMYYITGDWTVDGHAQFLPASAATCGSVPAGGDPGVLLYFASGQLKTGDANGVNLTNLLPEASGPDLNHPNPYANLLYWQATSGAAASLVNLSVACGGWYEPDQTLDITSTSTLTVPFVYAKKIMVEGGSTIDTIDTTSCQPPVTGSATPTAAPATSTPTTPFYTVTTTSVPVSTNTPVPNNGSTNTPVPNTGYPTNTPVPVNTNTPVPNNSATNTPVPVNTNTPVPVNTNTSIPNNSATNTPVPITTNTPVPANTNSPVPNSGNATNTPVPVSTNTPVLASTNTPKPVSTNTPVPVSTNTPLPISTNTPVPVSTNTPVPASTNTPVPASTYTPVAAPTNTPVPQPTFCPTGSGKVIALNGATSSSSFTMQGGTISAAEVDGNGTNPNAIWLSGGTITASTVKVVGGIKGQGGTLNGATSSPWPNTTTGSTTTSDPYAGLSAPSKPANGTGAPSGNSGSGTSGSTYHLTAGYYTSINFNTSTTWCFSPGLYYVEGTWTIDATDKLRPNSDSACGSQSTSGDPGVLLYFHTGYMQINSGGDLTHLSSMYSGSYAGLLYWQVSTSDPTPDYSFSGGAFYAPNASVTMNSGANFTVPYFIAGTFTMNSGSSINAGGCGPQAPTSTPVPANTNTPVPAQTNTPVPVSTNTPVLASTNTPVPANTNTPVPASTNTPVPANTNTPVPASTNTPVPVNTNTPVARATNTPVPVNTNTPVRISTNTPVPLNSFTPVPASTNTPKPVNTNTPVPQATNTPVPVNTNTPVGISTNTPVPISTNTPVPLNTTTPVQAVAQSASGTPTAIPTSVIAYSVGPFAIYGTPQASGPTAMLFTQNSTSGPNGGDTVVLFGQGYGWANGQYANRGQGLAGVPEGVSGVVHDASFEGCLTSGSTVTVNINGWTNFNHGGVGHCPPAPLVGSTITIPVIDQTTKNGDVTNCPQNGGYCAHVVAIVQVQITESNIPGIVEGTLVSKLSDPEGIIDDGTPNRSITATPAATNTPTSTPVSLYTSTPTAVPGPAYSIGLFAIYGTPQAGANTQMLFAYGAPHKSSGDLVTLFGQGWGWEDTQYANRSDGLAGRPSGVIAAANIHDASFNGCLNPDQTTIQVGAWTNYNHGGVGHCAPAPAVGSIITIPVIDKTTKNGDLTVCPQNGGYCAHVVAIVHVLIKDSSIPGIIDGVITNVVEDPQGIVETGRSSSPGV